MSSIESLIDKLIHDNPEISCRALKNLVIKLNTKIFTFNTVNVLITEKFTINLIKWISAILESGILGNPPCDESLFFQALQLLKECITNTDPQFIGKIKATFKLMVLINTIGSVNSNFRQISDELLHILASESDISYKDDIYNLSESKQIDKENEVCQMSVNPNISFSQSANCNNNNNNNSIVINPPSQPPQQTISMISSPSSSASMTSPSPLPPTFPAAPMSKNEEQFLFDVGINLKYGDAIQIYKSLNLLYTHILNDFPIQILLQKEDIVKSFLNILENSNFFEFGVICWKILDKILVLLENKIQWFISRESLALTSCDDVKGNINYLNISITQDNTPLSLETFLALSLNTLISSLYDVNKLHFYLPLLEKNLDFFQKLILLPNSDEWVGRIYEILAKLHGVVKHYKNEKLDISFFIRFIINIILKFSNDALYKLILSGTVSYYEDKEMITMIKDCLFIYPTSDLSVKIFEKFDKIKMNCSSNVQIGKLIDSCIEDYNNAELIRKSIRISKDILSGVDKLANDYQIIIDNFSNILISYKYIINDKDNPISQMPLVKILCDVFEQSVSEKKELAVQQMKRLITFGSNTTINSKFISSGIIYTSILNEIKVRSLSVLGLFLNNEVLIAIINDICKENIERQVEEIIIDVVFEILTLYMNNEGKFHNENFNKELLAMLPPFPKNFKYASLLKKIDSLLSANSSQVFLKYLRFLFHKDENVRVSAIYYFQTFSNHISDNRSLEIVGDSSGNSSNYSEFKKNDTLFLIQTITNEFSTLYKNVMSASEINIEFYPLLNILYSTKMDYNIKTSALDQMVLLALDKRYSQLFVGEILDYAVGELVKIVDDASKYSSRNFIDNQPNVSNYACALIKLIDAIVYFHSAEDKIKELLKGKGTSAVSDVVGIMMSLVLPKITGDAVKSKTRHLMSSYGLLFLFLFSFYEYNIATQLQEKFEVYQELETDEKDKSTKNEKMKLFHILPFYEKFFITSLIPNEKIELSNSFLEISLFKSGCNKHVIEYINVHEYSSEYQKQIFEISAIKSDIKGMNSSSDNVNYLEIYFSIAKFFACLTTNEESIAQCNELISLFTFFKKLLPVSREDKNIIMDFLTILDMFISSISVVNLSENKILSKAIHDIILNYLNFISINKDFVNNVAAVFENQLFVYEILEFIIRNKKFFFSKGSLGVVCKFIETYTNAMVFNNDRNFFQIRLYLIKFQSLFFQDIFIKCDGDGDIATRNSLLLSSLNTIEFYLSKYEHNDNYANTNYITWCLSFVVQSMKLLNVFELLIKKSFTFVKFLTSPIEEIVSLAIQILTMLISNELFEKHSTILTTIYDYANDKKCPKNIRINYFNFLIKAIEFILKNKSIDCDSEKGNDEVLSELLTMNEKIFDESELGIMMTRINSSLSSMESAMMLQYIETIIGLDFNILDNKASLSDGLFFNLSFYEITNDLIIRERDNLKKFIQLADSKNISSGWNTSKAIRVRYTNKRFRYINLFHSCIENILNVKEAISLVVKSLAKVRLDKELYTRYKLILGDVLGNVILYGQMVKCAWDRWVINDNERYISNTAQYFAVKAIQSYALKFFSLLQFMFDFKFEEDYMYDNIYQSTLSQENNNDNNTQILHPQVFFNLCYDFLKFDYEDNSEINLNFEIKVNFSKILPYLLELLHKYNSLKSSQPLNTITVLKNEGDTLLELMTAFKIAYDIKVEFYGTKVKCTFDIEDTNLPTKNDLMYAIISLLLISQNCKKIFVKSKFVNSFLDYLKQMTEILYKNNISISNKKNQKEIQQSSQRDSTLQYVKGEYKNALFLFQNIMYNFEDCEEREQLFVKIKNKTEMGAKFLKVLFDIFMEVIRHHELCENYLKLLINILSIPGDVSKYFVMSIKPPERKESLIGVILEYFNKNFLLFNSTPNFDLFIQLLKCLFRYRPIVLYLQKSKVIETLVKDFENLILNKKFMQNNSNSMQGNLKFIEQLLNLLISLSFETDVSKKIVSKEFINNLTEMIIRVKNENVIYSSLFLLRNVSFLNQNKLHFLANDNLLGTVIALFSGESSNKVKYMISHLLWVLLYNNQTLKGILSKDEFKSELKAISIHMQKEYDVKRLLKQPQEEGDRDASTYLEECCLNIRKIMHILEI